MSFGAFRALIAWYLIIALCAVAVFFVYFGTDLDNASMVVNTNVDSNNAAVNDWVGDRRAQASGYWHGLTYWRQQIYDGLTTPR